VYVKVTFRRKFKRQFYLNTLGMSHAAKLLQVAKESLIKLARKANEHNNLFVKAGKRT